MQLPVRDALGATVGTVEVSDELVGMPMNTAVVHQATVRQMANARQGTADTKTRGEVSGGGIKPRPQKHTGRSRQGSIRAPHWRKGGVVFGPHPRDYHQRMPKKMRRLAIRCLLSQKVRESRLTLLEKLELPEARTREIVKVLANLGVASKVLLVTPETDRRLVLSARNLGHVKTLPAPNLNVLDLLNYDQVVMTVGAIRRAEELWAGGAPGEAGEG
ncbi:MAG: 50S ribosomal protein L4 [Chloroflexi bacterium]|nr:50S ribosomal protein L4 [Chloroflexota bacterium]